MIPRRNFLRGAALGLGASAVPGMLAAHGLATEGTGAPHFAPRAKRVIWLFMSGAPSQIDMWDHKPVLQDMYDKDIPDSVVNGQRFTTMTSGQQRFPIAPSMFQFKPHGQSGTEVSELLPYTAKVVDDLCVIRSVNTTSINHDPGITFIQTGSELPGRPSMGAWLSYGLGSANRDLPTFVVLHSSWSAKRPAQALYSRLWGSGWLPSKHQGVSMRSIGDPVLFLSNPPGVNPDSRRRMLDGLAGLNARRQEDLGDPEIGARIAQYEMAHRMQSSVPELLDLSSEPEHVLDLYGPDVKKPGTFAYNCLMARRLAERDVRFTQVFIRGWDQHGNLPGDIRLQCRDVDQACAALVLDLKQRGMLDDTLIVWGGEFGRTAYCQGKLQRSNYGRDHHPRCYSMWLAGGGVRPGMTYGTTDDFSYNIVDKPVHIHDLNATVLHQLGIDHERLTYRFQGRDFRLTDVSGKVVHDILT
ncbi:MAG: hypothetical protein ACI9K5_000349 [Gammaproteobacteria bacterium]|jgi:hypothetical protein